MAKAYAHLDDWERILSYIDSRAYELNERIDTLRDENNLFVTITERYPECANTFTAFANKNDSILSEARSELVFWISIRNKLNPCQSCKGYGKFRVFETQNESHLEPCDACHGSGASEEK